MIFLDTLPGIRPLPEQIFRRLHALKLNLKHFFCVPFMVIFSSRDFMDIFL